MLVYCLVLVVAFMSPSSAELLRLYAHIFFVDRRYSAEEGDIDSPKYKERNHKNWFIAWLLLSKKSGKQDELDTHTKLYYN